MRTLDEEIAWWERRAYEKESDAALIAFGDLVAIAAAILMLALAWLLLIGEESND